MMQWFGKDYGAPIYKDCPNVAVPEGDPCVFCSEEITLTDDGFVVAGGSIMHRACFLRSIYGSVAHQEKRCSCYVPGAEEDVPGGTTHQAAKEAVLHYEAKKRTAAMRLLRG